MTEQYTEYNNIGIVQQDIQGCDDDEDDDMNTYRPR